MLGKVKTTEPGEKARSIVMSKDAPLRTFLHYSDPNARKELTVFGQSRTGLFYNYDDRLISEKWIEGLKLAAEKATKNSARYFELALSHFHDKNVNLEHVILGCNRRVLGYSCVAEISRFRL